MKKILMLLLLVTGLNAWSQLPNLNACATNNDPIAVFDLTANTDIMIMMQPSSDYTVNYYQTLTDALLPQNAIANAFAFVGVSGQTIYARAQHLSSSTYMVQHFDLIVNSTQPSVADGFICTNSFGIPINIYNINSGLSASQYTFYWTQDGTIIPGANDNNYTAMVPGTYTVNATSILTGCSGSDTSIVSPFTMLQNGTAEVNGTTVTINATPTGTYEYRLDDGDFQDSNVFEGVSAAIHIVYIRDLVGCSTLAFAFDSTLGISEMAAQQFTFGPNPVTDTLRFSNLSGVTTVSVANLMGQVILKKPISETNDALDLSGFQAGMYLVSLDGEMGQKTLKIIKR